jgi:D-alanyl-D-alanine carboxypeptidase
MRCVHDWNDHDNNFLNILGGSMKQTTLEKAIERYGHIDFQSKRWPDESKWMANLILRPDWFPNFKYAGTNYPVKAIYCNIDMHDQLFQSFASVAAMGLGEKLKTFDGCFNIRMVRGNPNHPSAHAYGLAIDLNASENGLGQTSGGFFNEPMLVNCFEAHGLNWGGRFRNRLDGMHLSFCWE